MMSAWWEKDATPTLRRRSRSRARSGPRGPGGEPGTGGGVAGHSRELLRGVLLYAGRGIPVFPCEPQGKRPLTADGFRLTESGAVVVFTGRAHAVLEGGGR